MASGQAWRAQVPGLVVCTLLGFAAVELASVPGLAGHGISPLTVAIVIGMLLGNSVYARIAMWAGPGVTVARTTLLRTGVVLYGFRLTLQDIAHVGWAGVLIDALVLGSTFLLSYQLGTRLLGLDRASSMLVGAGSAICGAAAVLAAEPVVRGRPEQVSVAVAGVVVFGTISMFLNPFLYILNGAWHVIPGDAATFGIYIGSTVHEVAQVVAAGRQVGPEAAGTAVIAKMVRVLMLAPFLVVLATWLKGQPTDGGAAGVTRRGPAVPAFAFIFVGVVLCNSLDLVPRPIVDLITRFDTFLLAAAMGALGLSTHFGTLRRSGGRSMVLATLLFVWLVVGGAMINRFVTLLAS
jgi:uncharacterized integral membrane protein (TIGR00698 family)